MKASDIDDQDFLAAVRQLGMEYHSSLSLGVTTYELSAELGYPEKVVLAKARRLLSRGLITGCACGCRGDFRVV